MIDNVDLIAICENNNFIRKFAEKAMPNIRFVSVVETLLDMNLDAVCLTTPPVAHYSIMKMLYEKKITRNILTEKPLAMNYQQAQQLCQLADLYGGTNMVGYQCRYSVTYQKAKELQEAGLIGKLTAFKCYAYSADFLGAKSSVHAKRRGGVLEDLGCHIVDLALWFLRELEVTEANITSIITEDSQDEIHMLVRTPSQITGEISCSWCKEGYRLPEIFLSLKGENGYISVNEDKVELGINNEKTQILYKQDLNDYTKYFSGGTHYYRQDTKFIQGIREGSAIEPSFKTASKVHEIIDKVAEVQKKEK
jgi:Predicted dehydrogenases and related proteins